ncbi:MAG: nucleotidyltransferase domain-containing protein [Nitrospinae bacterium]|nr:nucleotidyltransferase domain-containing protein [Nitrospinota bacterium]
MASLPAELKEELGILYGERLVHLALFGSQARDDFEEGSDIDVLVVLDGNVRPYDEIQRTGEIVSALSLRNREVVSCVFWDKETWLNGGGPLSRNIRREGIAI